MNYLKVFLTLFLFSLCGFVLAQDMEPKPELANSFILLIDALKIGIVAPILVAIMRLLKTDWIEKKLFKIHSGLQPLVVILLGLVAEMLIGTSEGRSWFEVAIQGLINGGAAIALYDIIGKHFFAKKISA